MTRLHKPETAGPGSRRRSALLLILVLLSSSAHAVEVTGRLSTLGSAAWSGLGDIGYSATSSKPLMLDQESLRLMLDDNRESVEWSLHVKALRQNFVRFPATTPGSNDLFRSDNLTGYWQNDRGTARQTRSGYDVDRAVVKFRKDTVTFAVGRQAIDWGSGRFWQPFNVFGAFAPTDLDTDYKPGIDAAVAEWFPSAFSTLNMVFVPALNRALVRSASGAAHFRSQVGESSEIGFLGGRVLSENLGGASFESDLMGVGWRIEALYTTANRGSVFWIAGIDYQFDEGTTVALEWYENSAGAVRESQLALLAGDLTVRYGLRQQLGRHLLGFAATRDITPLLNGNYTLLASGLKDSNNATHFSLLHQLSLTYSVSNESDLLLSLLTTTGKGLDAVGLPQSEFGHIPLSTTMRYRIYF